MVRDLEQGQKQNSYKSRNVVQAIAFGSVVGQCGECLRRCPICIRVRSLKSRVDKKR